MNHPVRVAGIVVAVLLLADRLAPGSVRAGVLALSLLGGLGLLGTAL